MIISVTNLKGGVGKSTVSLNLAVWFAHQGKKVCILDTDIEQRTSMRWAGERHKIDGLPDVDVFGVESEQIIKASAKQATNYDIVIIDGSPQLGKTALATAMASDLVLVPMTPSAFDLWSFENFLKIFQQVKDVKEPMGATFKAFIVLNRYMEKTNLDKNVAEIVQQFGVGVMQSTLGYRVAYRETPITGLGVMEAKGEKKAKEEIEHLGKEIETIINSLHS